MGFLPDALLSGLGIGYSIGALALVVPFCFMFRGYLRLLDHLQLLMAFALGLASTEAIFSNQLSISWAQFNKSFLAVVCDNGDLVCSAGFQLSFGCCLLVFLLIMRIIVAIQTYRKKDIRFEPVYTFFKGFTRWIYAALCYYSIYYLTASLKKKQDSLLSSIGVTAICVLFPICQIVGYKLIQSETDYIWRKWLQFANFYRLLLIMGLVGVAVALSSRLPFYFIYGVEVLYTVLFAWKNSFVFKAAGRVVFIIGEIILLVLFSFFLFKAQIIVNYNLDLFGVSLMFLMDLVYYTVEIVYIQKHGIPAESNEAKVNPEASEQGNKNKRSNAYEIDLNDFNDNEFDNSQENILGSSSRVRPSKEKAAPARARRK